MKTTISLGKELEYITNQITDVFTTNDYFGELERQYKEHVLKFYEGDITNDFDQIYRFKKFISQGSYKFSPCENPLENIEEIEDDLRHILGNRGAFEAVFKIFLSDAKDCSNKQVGTLISNVLNAIRKGSTAFKEVAILMDRHLGNQLSVACLIKSIVSYGVLSGLVDYYNLQEGKDD